MNFAEMVIIGFQKCGQTALSSYLKCKVNELIYYPDATDRFKSHYQHTHRPVFITRDPTEKLWSEYHYFERYREEMTFIEFLDYRSDQVDQGYTTPVERCDYFRWIEPFKQFNPLVLSLENMQTLMQPMNGGKIKPQRTINEDYAIMTRTNQLVAGLR